MEFLTCGLHGDNIQILRLAVQMEPCVSSYQKFRKLENVSGIFAGDKKLPRNIPGNPAKISGNFNPNHDMPAVLEFQTNLL